MEKNSYERAVVCCTHITATNRCQSLPTPPLFFDTDYRPILIALKLTPSNFFFLVTFFSFTDLHRLGQLLSGAG